MCVPGSRFTTYFYDILQITPVQNHEIVFQRFFFPLKRTSLRCLRLLNAPRNEFK